MKLGGMKRAINGLCIDTEEMVGAMTQDERLHLMEQLVHAMQRWQSITNLQTALENEQ